MNIFRLGFITGVVNLLLLQIGLASANDWQGGSPKQNDTPEFTDVGLQASSIASLSSVFVSLQAEYQPPFIQTLNLGVLGLGVSASGADFIIGKTNLGFGLGVTARYQFRYFQNQFIVPMIGYQYEIRTYNSATSKDSPETFSNKPLRSPFYGVWILLNSFEPLSAWSMRNTYGFKKTYLTLEMRNNFSLNSDLDISNYNFYFGIRFEH